jgi:hypothetical protein
MRFRPLRSCDFDNESHAKIERATDSIAMLATSRLPGARKGICRRGPCPVEPSARRAERSPDCLFPHAHVLTAEDIVPLSEQIEWGTWFSDAGAATEPQPLVLMRLKGVSENFVGARVEDFTVVTPGEVSQSGLRFRTLMLRPCRETCR